MFILFFIFGVGIFFTLSFIQKKHISQEKSLTSEIEKLAIEVNEAAHELNLLDLQGVAFSIPFSSIPVYEKYLYEQSDTLIEIERSSFELLPINSLDDSKYGLLTYNCGVKSCSSLLVKLSNTFTSIELGYGMLIDMKQSSNLEHAVFRYGINEGNIVLRNSLIPVNLENMALINPVSKELSQGFIENATWPITEYKWDSDQKLSIRVADIQDTDYDSLLTWFNSSKKTKKVEVELVNE